MGTVYTYEVIEVLEKGRKTAKVKVKEQFMDAEGNVSVRERIVRMPLYRLEG